MLHTFVPSARDVRALVRLAVPIATVQVGIMLMAVVDTMVVGHVSARELAAAALGNLYFYGFAGFGMGVVWAVDPIVSQALGAGDREAAPLGVQRAVVVAALVGVTSTLLSLPAERVFRGLGQVADVVPRAAAFVHVSAASWTALLVFVALRQALQAMRQTRAIVGAIVVGNVVNLALNLVFVFGRFGVPAMGAVGSALASVCSRYLMVALVLVAARRELGPVLRPWRRAALALGPLARTVRLGLPIGLQNSVEYATFASISVFAGWFGAAAIGGTQGAINLASLTFMVPMGVGSAASVLVGHAIGEGDLAHARRLAASALLVGAAFMVVAAGVLRGSGDTRAPLVSNLLGFWLEGMPVSLLLGFRAGLGVVGLWWGFVAGLAAVAAFLVGRVRVRLSRPVARIRVDADTAART